MTETILEIKRALTFTDIISAFSGVFNFDAKYWRESVERGHKSLKDLEAAEKTVDPIDRAIMSLSVIRDIPMSRDLEVVGYTHEQYRERVNVLSPKREDGLPMGIGEVAYHHYLHAGTLPDDGWDVPLSKRAEIKTEIESLYKRIREIGRKYENEMNARIEDHHQKAGYYQLREAFLKQSQKYSDDQHALWESVESGKISSEEYYRAISDLHQKGSASYDKYQENIKPIRDETKKFWNKCNIKIAEECEPLNAEIEALESENKAICQQFYEKVMDDILENSPITPEEAENWANMQAITDSAKRRLQKMKYPVEQIRTDMAEFYRLTGGRVAKTHIVTHGHRRAQANVYSGTVYLDGNFNKGTLFHEMAHLLESSEHIKMMSNTFLQKRTGGNTAIKSLRTLTKNSRYRSGERAYEDDFFNPYVGKIYENGITEVCSMGFQQFSSPELMTELYQKDPEMFQLIYGMIKTPASELEQQASKAILRESIEQQSMEKNSKAFYNALDKKAAKIEKLIEGTYYRIESWSSGGKKQNRFNILYRNDLIDTTTFTSIKYARRFLYLYLWAGMVGGKQEADRLKPYISKSVEMDAIPPYFFQDPNNWEIVDVKIPDEDRIPAEELN